MIMTQQSYGELSGDEEDNDEASPPLVTKKFDGLSDDEMARFKAWHRKANSVGAEESPHYYTSRQVNELLEQLIDAVEEVIDRTLTEEREVTRQELADLRKDFEITALRKEVATLKE